MSALVLLMTTMMVMKSKAAFTKIITVSSHSDGSVLLPAEGGGRLEHGWDVRWTHPHLVLSLKNNMTTCHHGRCELLSDGSLRFNRVQIKDSGTYRLEVFYENGTQQMRKDFLLHVEAAGDSSSTVAVSISCLLLFLLLLSFIIFILRRRGIRHTDTSGQTEENVYVKMLSHCGKEGEDDVEKKQEKEEDPVYVSCNPALSMETPITQQTVEDDVYV
ncbi:uncharacterized protein LOC114869118 isoform X2 [Betta splendens]|uniref:Uncharacterized protein LOC114869118 isoform X2 n=1 Tax=Betta splendens TaxID=158456 RepID=A0A9W2Y9R9_BETSP|nr:uncharacterized protein LOC114869118 isoform X2 [Betta splendens]